MNKEELENLGDLIKRDRKATIDQIIKMIEGMERLKLAHDIQLGTDVDLISKDDLLSKLREIDKE